MGLLTILSTVFIRLLLSTQTEWEDNSNEGKAVLDLVKHSARNDLRKHYVRWEGQLSNSLRNGSC